VVFLILNIARYLEVKMQNVLKSRATLYVGIALILIGVSGLASSSKEPNNVVGEAQAQQVVETETRTITSNANGTLVKYSGMEGSTALDILKSGAQVQTEDSSFGEFVTSINGVEQTDSKYWLFYVNDQAASVGAADYVTNEGDTVEWRLES
jgi:hypothetical protein